jgi:hypothetical protein
MAVEGGYSLLWRRFFEHRYWIERRAFNRAEAFLDCFANLAAWKDHVAIVGGVSTPVARGEFIASDRFLEKRWQWSRGKVRRFMADAIHEGELERVRSMSGGCAMDGTTGGTVYRVVKYEEYQNPWSRNDATDDTVERPLTDQRERKKRKGKNTSTPSAFDLLFEAEWFEYPKKTAKAEAKRLWDKLIQTNDAKTIAAGIRRYVTYMQARNSEVIFYAKLVNFLKDEQWKEEWAIEGIVPLKAKQPDPDEWWVNERIV